MTNNPPSYESKRERLLEVIREAVNEQARPTRLDYYPVPGEQFEARINQTFWRRTLADLLMQTDALDILADMVAAIDEEIPAKRFPSPKGRDRETIGLVGGAPA